MNWYDSLPAADTQVPCGSGSHTVRWEAGQLTLPSHPDAEAELVLAALGGDKPACVAVAETWATHTADLGVLATGPRCVADRVSVSREEIEQQRTGLPPSLSQGLGDLGGAVQGSVQAGNPARPGQRPGTALASGMAETLHRQQQRLELLELLALGAALQFRLSGAVCAAWAGPDRADERASHRPELAAALTGRFAPAAEEWLGIDPDAVTVTPHEGPGWGSVELTGQGRGPPPARGAPGRLASRRMGLRPGRSRRPSGRGRGRAGPPAREGPGSASPTLGAGRDRGPRNRRRPGGPPDVGDNPLVTPPSPERRPRSPGLASTSGHTSPSRSPCA